MGRWKEESPQQQTTRTVQDVPSLESRSNGMIFKDVSSNYPITSHTNMNHSCSKVVHAFGQTHFLQNLSDDKMEHIRKTMIRHEEMFKEQVKALHRLYNIQRSAMHEIRKHSFSPHNLSIFSTTSIHLQDDASKISDVTGKLHQVSPFKQEEIHSISITRPKSPLPFTLTDENIAKCNGQSSLWDGEKKANNSAVKEKRARKTIDLERPPEEYLDDFDDFSENQEREMREAGNLDQVSVAPRNVLDTDKMLRGSEKFSTTTQIEEQFSKQREWFSPDTRRHAERENLESFPLKRLKGSQDDADLPTDLKDSIDQGTSTPTRVQSTSGTVMSIEKEGKINRKSSEWESNSINHGQHDKKQKHQSSDMELKDKPSDINTKLPSWFPQATVAGSRNPENDSPSQMTSWMLAPVFSQPQGWNFVGNSEDSFIQGKGIFPFLTDIKMSSTAQDMDKENVNKEAQNCEENGSTQENLIRHPTESFQTILASNPYGGSNQLTPVVFPTGYPVGAAIPAIGMQWSVAAQGFVFPAVNKTSEMGPLPNPLSAAWCPQGAYFQLYPYQQQVLHSNKFSAPCHSADPSMQRDGHMESVTPGRPIPQAENATSLQAKTKRCHEESSSVNGPEGFPRPQHSSITSANPTFDRTVGCTMDSRDIQKFNHSERRISMTGNQQSGEPSKTFNTSEKHQINARVSRCSNHSLDTQEVEGQQELSKDCKSELRTTEAVSTEQTLSRILVSESKSKDEDGSKSSSSGKGNYPLIEKRGTSQCECSAGQAVSQDSKELQKIANAPDKNLQTTFKIQGMQTELSGLLNLEESISIDASHKMHWLSTEKSEMCASRMGSQKETNKIDDLDSSGHGSNNLVIHVGKQCGVEDARQLDPIDTYTSICSGSKVRERVEDRQQVETNGIHNRTESVQIEEPEGALADDKEQFNKVYCQPLTSNSHVKIQRGPRNELNDLKKEECPSGEKVMEDIQTDSLKHRDRMESLIDTPLSTQLSCNNQMLALQNDNPITKKMTSKEGATETPKECNKSQESKGVSEEEEEARENLAANILLSLVKDMSERSSSVTKESVIHQQGHAACVGPSSSHSSRDSTCHRSETKNSTRRSKPRTREAGVEGGAVGWTKSIRGKRRRTQRPRT